MKNLRKYHGMLLEAWIDIFNTRLNDVLFILKDNKKKEKYDPSTIYRFKTFWKKKQNIIKYCQGISKEID